MIGNRVISASSLSLQIPPDYIGSWVSHNGTNTLYDSSVNSYHAVVRNGANATFTTDTVQLLNYEPLVTPVLDINSNILTMSIKFYTNITSSFGVLFSHIGTTPPCQLYHNNNRLYMSMREPEGNPRIRSIPLTDSSTKHIIIEFNKSIWEVKVYDINGDMTTALDGAGTPSTNNFQSLSSWFLTHPQNNVYMFNGRLYYKTRFYNRVLTPLERTALFADGL